MYKRTINRSSAKLNDKLVKQQWQKPTMAMNGSHQIFTQRIKENKVICSVCPNPIVHATITTHSDNSVRDQIVAVELSFA